MLWKTVPKQRRSNRERKHGGHNYLVWNQARRVNGNKNTLRICEKNQTAYLLRRGFMVDKKWWSEQNPNQEAPLTFNPLVDKWDIQKQSLAQCHVIRCRGLRCFQGLWGLHVYWKKAPLCSLVFSYVHVMCSWQINMRHSIKITITVVLKAHWAIMFN